MCCRQRAVNATIPRCRVVPIVVEPAGPAGRHAARVRAGDPSVDVDGAVVLWVAWFFLGTVVGSFLNVCIYRMPREESVVRPRSRCPRCERPIAGYDNIPLVSYALLGGRCRHCRTPISWRYPLVEALAGAAAVAVVYRFGATAQALVYGAFLCALIAVSFIDLEFQIIPDEISLGGVAAGLLISLALPSLHGAESRWLSLGRAAVGALVGGGVLYLTGKMGDLMFRRETMGGGDIKLLAMAGSVLGWKLVLLTFFLAPMLALIPGLLVLLLRRSHEIPYGPFLSLGLVIALFAGQDVLRWTGVEESARILWEYYAWR
ncbi:MAG: prepilin peptidase [Candidatus Omnitrophica bacterium]|nr:prepilin peptidase [Candidatus Omnitrophota bacterium]